MDFDERVKSTLAEIKQRIASLDEISKGLRKSGVDDRYKRWRDSTGGFIRRHISSSEASRFFSRTERSSSISSADEARLFLVSLEEDLIRFPENVLYRTIATSQASEPTPSPKPSQRNPAMVFVVYGRNEAARAALFDYLRALKLDPLEWSQVLDLTAMGAPYIGAALDRAFDEAAAFVVLLTGDELAKLVPAFVSEPKDDQVRNQPRPNVIFEAGMAFGRHPDRTILVEVGPVSPFSDIVGRYAIRLDNTPAKRKALAQALERVGCAVDMSGDDWLTKYDFESVVPRVGGADAAYLVPRNDARSSLPERPTLRLDFDPKDGLCFDNTGGDQHFRVQVWNDGEQRAENVRVVLDEVEPPAPSLRLEAFSEMKTGQQTFSVSPSTRPSAYVDVLMQRPHASFGHTQVLRLKRASFLNQHTKNLRVVPGRVNLRETAAFCI